MVAIIETCQLFEHAHLFTPFKLVHLLFAGDAEQVLENAPARTVLKLVFIEGEQYRTGLSCAYSSNRSVRSVLAQIVGN